MRRLLLKSLVKAHKKLHCERDMILARIKKLEAIASKHASRNNPEVLEIIGKLGLIRKQIEK
jgi:hypothetical protein